MLMAWQVSGITKKIIRLYPNLLKLSWKTVCSHTHEDHTEVLILA